MKKVTFLMALAVAAGMVSCTAQSPKADLKTKAQPKSIRKTWLTWPVCK